MKKAIPIVNEKLCMHFGHCETFEILTVDPEKKMIVTTESKNPPPHEPGVLPKWLGEQKVNVILAGGMGQRAQELFTAQGIQVVVGAPADAPEALVQSYLAGSLTCGENVCDH